MSWTAVQLVTILRLNLNTNTTSPTQHQAMQHRQLQARNRVTSRGAVFCADVPASTVHPAQRQLPVQTRFPRVLRARLASHSHPLARDRPPALSAQHRITTARRLSARPTPVSRVRTPPTTCRSPKTRCRSTETEASRKTVTDLQRRRRSRPATKCVASSLSTSVNQSNILVLSYFFCCFVVFAGNVLLSR